MNKKLTAIRDELKIYHGCYMGGCPHNKQTECFDSLIDSAVSIMQEREEILLDIITLFDNAHLGSEDGSLSRSYIAHARARLAKLKGEE